MMIFTYSIFLFCMPSIVLQCFSSLASIHVSLLIVIVLKKMSQPLPGVQSSDIALLSKFYDKFIVT